MNKQIEHKGRLFESPILESLTRTSPLVAFTLYPLFSIGLFFFGLYYFKLSAGLSILVAFGGFFSWTLLEYLMHRYLFHIGGENRFIRRFRYMMHGIHHDFPKDKHRLIMPPVPWLIYTIVLTGIFYLFMRNYVFVFMPGLLLGYCCYVSIHYLIHIAHPPHILRRLIIHHSLHHYRFPDHAFGVSSTLWDRVFGTMPPRHEEQGHHR